jgi:hypothetical protein
MGPNQKGTVVNINFELNHQKEYEAFADFCKKMAEVAPVVAADQDERQLRLFGGSSLQQASTATPEAEKTADEGTSTSEQSDLSAATADAPARERGKPAQGRARRTKEEIAEDEAADAAEAAAKTAGEETGAVVADRQISTGGERVDPENPEDAAQDAADEAAETAAAKAETGNKLTHDDVRNALGAYVKAYGMPAAQEDGPKVITLMFGEGKSKVSDIPDTQEDLSKAVAGIKEMTTKNPYSRAADL